MKALLRSRLRANVTVCGGIRKRKVKEKAMKNRYWVVECPKCKKSADVSVGNFRKIVRTDFEFILKPVFVCSECESTCKVELKKEKENG